MGGLGAESLRQLRWQPYIPALILARRRAIAAVSTQGFRSFQKFVMTVMMLMMGNGLFTCEFGREAVAYIARAHARTHTHTHTHTHTPAHTHTHTHSRSLSLALSLALALNRTSTRTCDMHDVLFASASPA